MSSIGVSAQVLQAGRPLQARGEQRSKNSNRRAGIKSSNATTSFRGRALECVKANAGIRSSSSARAMPTRLSVEAVAAPASSATVVEENKTDPLADYIERHGGKRVIRKILIANNGMAAVKAIVSMRRWAYLEVGDETALQFVAMPTPEDLAANAEFIRQADDFVEVPGGSNKNNYANVDLIVQIAKQQNVDAVWPGWGHASENPKLPKALKENGITFLGPPSPVMSVLGDKIAANILAQTANVPSIPWSGDGLTADLTDEGTIPDEIFRKAMVNSVEEALEVAERIGYPVMIKASEGGGGKGIRKSTNESQLRAQYEQVVAEVPGSPVFMMQLCTSARHLEVQIVGDEHGNAIALNGRDCSTQRRFQKIFEEGPPVIAEPEIFRQMERSAQRLCKNIGYQGAGTVEYLYNAETQKYFFLELNPRLQVEHPVTEGITGVNVPSIQLQVGMGIPLYRIADVRRFYGEDPEGVEEIDFLTAEYQLPKKHTIAARITAENPDEGFKPTSGRIDRIQFQSTPKVWGYFSVGANGAVHEFADSQFGHLFATGETREDARKALVMALKDLVVRGEIRTAVEYLAQLLETEEFKNNTIDTSWLDGLIAAKGFTVSHDPHLVVASAILYRAHCRYKEKLASLSEAWSKGQAPLRELDDLNKFDMTITYLDTKYNFTVTKGSKDEYSLQIGDEVVKARVREQSDGTLLAIFAGATHILDCLEEPLGLRMVLDGTTILLPNQFDPSELRTDVTGKLIRFLQDDGTPVSKGEPYAEVEAMKMVMPLVAGESGKISHKKASGAVIEAGDLLAKMELSDPSQVKSLVTFEGQYTLPMDDVSRSPGLRMPVEPQKSGIELMQSAKEKIHLVLDGYEHDYEKVVQDLLLGLTETESTDASALWTTATNVLTEVIEHYLSVEEKFSGRQMDAVVNDLMKKYKDKPETITDVMSAEQNLAKRTSMLLALLKQVPTLPQRVKGFGPIGWEDDYAPLSDTITSALQRVSRLRGPAYGEVALLASNMLIEKSLPPIKKRLKELRGILAGRRGLLRLWPGGNVTAGDLDAIVESPTLAVDLLPSLFKDPDVGHQALQIYTKRMYRAHQILHVETTPAETEVPTCYWEFQYDTPQKDSPVRRGIMTVLNTLDEIDLSALMDQMEERLPAKESDETRAPINVMHIALARQGDVSDLTLQIVEMLQANAERLRELGTKFVNVLAYDDLDLPRYYTFTERADFKEDMTYRGMRPTMSHLLELSRLTIYNLERIPTVNRDLHIYVSEVKQDPSVRGKPESHLLLRRISHSKDICSGGLERILLKAFESVELAMLDPRAAGTSSTRLYFNMLPYIGDGDCMATVDSLRDKLANMISQKAPQLLKNRIDEIEIRLRVMDGEDVVPVRVMASSMSGQWLKIDCYKEFPHPVTGAATHYCVLGDSKPGSDITETCYVDPYPVPSSLQRKRSVARRINSTYCYDFLGLFEKSLVAMWADHTDALGEQASKLELPLFQAEELVLVDGELMADERMAGTNKVGMVAWHCVMKTPEYPEGRAIVLIANDCTVKSGSFGVEEDWVYKKASEYARRNGLPRVYIACNAGARIGLIDELKKDFQIAWNDPTNPSLGFKYLYLTKERYESLAEGTVNVREITESGEQRYMLTDIIGQTHGIGVENLQGSGMIAGETSLAYDETFTLNYITGRSVGIGAYLCRLGQRNIQMQHGPLILTGYQALNKLLGRQVYTSQDQLGGPQVMIPNGVSHQLVNDDQEGVAAILNWLAYTPAKATLPPPSVPSSDSPDRPIEFMPTKTPYDPRHMLAGVEADDGTWKSGFFDRGSFTETLAEWGKSVVVGRARLGGIPMGVIAVETRLMEQRIPADPADDASREMVLAQAGQVWFPDSAHKTAQAIKDFNRGENLPLIIFANWRGFSGGTRDMYAEILKFGAMIVDALRTYQHPAFIYIPPNGELRGGAWVVVDPTINPDRMEMYADEESRGGILEPPGICEVKYRKAEQIATMHRTDPVLQQLDEDPVANKDAIEAREAKLLPLYLQVAHEFADLHDRSGRMKAKGVIEDVVQWKNARSYFHKRLVSHLESHV
eukprot:scaffold3827_cov394-Prasinococcus_capsulatus_cf.AAC.7